MLFWLGIRNLLSEIFIMADHFHLQQTNLINNRHTRKILNACSVLSLFLRGIALRLRILSITTCLSIFTFSHALNQSTIVHVALTNILES